MKTRLVYKMIAKVYDVLDIVCFRNYERSPRKAVLERVSDNDKILDLCTGTATNAINIASRKTSSQIVGVDLSRNMLKVARSKVKKAQVENVKLYQMNATQTKFKSECFDKILISLVLHELDEELAAKCIIEARRVLKDDGEIIITEWEPSKRVSKCWLFMLLYYLEPKTYRRFIKKDLYSYFLRYGLKVEHYVHCDYTKVIILRKVRL